MSEGEPVFAFKIQVSLTIMTDKLHTRGQCLNELLVISAGGRDAGRSSIANYQYPI